MAAGGRESGKGQGGGAGEGKAMAGGKGRRAMVRQYMAAAAPDGVKRQYMASLAGTTRVPARVGAVQRCYMTMVSGNGDDLVGAAQASCSSSSASAGEGDCC